MYIVIAMCLPQIGLRTSDGGTNDQVVKRCYEITECRGFGLPGIFVECDIMAIVQAILDAPMLPIQPEQACR
jgi:hypothetical protein